MFVYNWHNNVGLPFIIHTNGIINKRMVRFNTLPAVLVSTQGKPQKVFLLQPTGDLMYFTGQHFAPAGL